MIMPMLEIVYWKGKMPPRKSLSINRATMIGTLMGQVTFGILGDRYGRKKMYGVLLIIIMVATVGMALCSIGAQNSVDILAWIVTWRLLMGIGIGGGYPLSSVITAECVAFPILRLSLVLTPPFQQICSEKASCPDARSCILGAARLTACAYHRCCYHDCA